MKYLIIFAVVVFSVIGGFAQTERGVSVKMEFKLL